MALSDLQIRGAKPKDHPYKLTDEKGLYLLVSSTSRLWRFDYRFGGKRKTLALGAYPEISLRDARERRDAARSQVAKGIDPCAVKQAEKRSRSGADAFETIARGWLDRMRHVWSAGHLSNLTSSLERDVFPWIGNRPVDTVTAPEILAVLRRVESRGAIDTAHRVHQNIGQIMRYAVATGRAERDPAADLRGALSIPSRSHFPAPTDPTEVGALLRVIDDYRGSFTVRCALRLAPLVFVRPGELRAMRWADIDLDAAEWRYTVTKTRTEHIVPLSVQALAILQDIEPLTGRGPFVFQNERTPGRCVSENALVAALRRMDIAKEEFTLHGWRAVARTLLDEQLGFPPHLIEHQLAHAVRDPLGRAYNRTAHLADRKAMMQQWADYLDSLREPGNVVTIRRMTHS